MQRHIRHVAILAGASWLALAAAQAGVEEASLVQADDPYFKQARAQMQRIMTQPRTPTKCKRLS